MYGLGNWKSRRRSSLARSAVAAAPAARASSASALMHLRRVPAADGEAPGGVTAARGVDGIPSPRQWRKKCAEALGVVAGAGVSAPAPAVLGGGERRSPASSRPGGGGVAGLPAPAEGGKGEATPGGRPAVLARASRPTLSRWCRRSKRARSSSWAATIRAQGSVASEAPSASASQAAARRASASRTSAWASYASANRPCPNLSLTDHRRRLRSDPSGAPPRPPRISRSASALRSRSISPHWTAASSSRSCACRAASAPPAPALAWAAASARIPGHAPSDHTGRPWAPSPPTAPGVRGLLLPSPAVDCVGSTPRSTLPALAPRGLPAGGGAGGRGTWRRRAASGGMPGGALAGGTWGGMGA